MTTRYNSGWPTDDEGCVLINNDVAPPATAFYNSNSVMDDTGLYTSGGVPPPPAAPVDTVAPVASGNPNVGSVLSCTTGTWTGTPPITFTYQWYNNGGAISGATNNTYTLQASDLTDSIDCLVTATNAYGTNNSASNPIGPIELALEAPVNSVAPAVTGTTVVGETLTSTGGTWLGYPAPTLTYQWKRDGSLIVGANSNTYLLEAADDTHMIKCSVTGTNSSGSASADSNSVGPITSGAWTPLELFALGEQGVWYDPSDFSTMFQVAYGPNGGTPVTAVGQPVGLLLDKSQGLVLGPELVLNGDFSNGETSWAFDNFANDANDYHEVVGGELHVVITNATSSTVKQAVFTAGEVYRVQLTIRTVNSGRVVIYAGTSDISFKVIAAAGTYSIAATVQSNSGGTLRIANDTSDSVEYYLDNVSVKELPGNHATQATAASRPVLAATGISEWLNFDGVDDVLNTAFTSSLGADCTVAIANVGSAPTILTAQSIGTSYAASTDNAGLVIVNRALTGQETTDLTTWLADKGATS